MTDFEDTIVAISTPPGRGGIGIIRLSGPAARTIAEPLLKLRHPLAPAQARFAEILDDTGETLDEAVVTYFHAPNSYTSESSSTTSSADASPPGRASPNPVNSLNERSFQAV